MRAVALFSLFVTLVAGVCFDNGDCLLTPHATCSKTQGGLLGSCIASATATTTAPAKTGGSVCFDNGDCLLTPHATCSKTQGGIIGSCVTSATVTSTATAPATTTGSICFDDGDCILSGGKCVKQKGKITGNCAKSS